MNELYQILKVKPNATREEIHKSFRRLAKETHPDLNGNDDKKIRQFKEIKDAYDILSDPEKRSNYDAAQKISNTPRQANPSGVDNTIRDQVLGLLLHQIKLKRRRWCDLFVGCVLVVLMGFVIWNRHSLEMYRVLSVVRIDGPKEAIAILGILLGMVLLVLILDTIKITRIHFKLKKILKRKG